MIKKCQFGNNAYIETRSENVSSTPQSAVNVSPIVRLQSLFTRNNTNNQQTSDPENVGASNN